MTLDLGNICAMIAYHLMKLTEQKRKESAPHACDCMSVFHKCTSLNLLKAFFIRHCICSSAETLFRWGRKKPGGGIPSTTQGNGGAVSHRNI